MAETLDRQILQVVARESTHQWAYLGHDQQEFTLWSDSFSLLFKSLSKRSADEQMRGEMHGHPSFHAPPLFPSQQQLLQLLVARQYHILADHFAPEFDLRYYSLGSEEGVSFGTLLFVESRYRIELTSDRAKQARHAAKLIEGLSPRESEVMTFVVAGHTNQSTAAELGLSPKTVEKHRKKMMTKLQAESVAEVARIAFDAELHDQLLAVQDQRKKLLT